MMTVLDEANKIEKYEYIVFVEFLEMLCRIAIIGIKIQDLIEYKVHLLFEIIWDKMIERGEFDLTDHPLKEVDESNWWLVIQSLTKGEVAFAKSVLVLTTTY